MRFPVIGATCEAAARMMVGGVVVESRRWGLYGKSRRLRFGLVT